jgi:hypothetical protein
MERPSQRIYRLQRGANAMSAIDELRRLREWLINGNFFGHGPDVFAEINRRITELEAEVARG